MGGRGTSRERSAPPSVGGRRLLRCCRRLLHDWHAVQAVRDEVAPRERVLDGFCTRCVGDRYCSCRGRVSFTSWAAFTLDSRKRCWCRSRGWRLCAVRGGAEGAQYRPRRSWSGCRGRFSVLQVRASRRRGLCGGGRRGGLRRCCLLLSRALFVVSLVPMVGRRDLRRGLVVVHPPLRPLTSVGRGGALPLEGQLEALLLGGLLRDVRSHHAGEVGVTALEASEVLFKTVRRFLGELVLRPEDLEDALEELSQTASARVRVGQGLGAAVPAPRSAR